MIVLVTSFVTTYCPQSSFNKADLNQVLALPHFDLFYYIFFAFRSQVLIDLTLSGEYTETRGRKRTQEEVLALCSRQPGTCEGESNFMRTFQKSQASAPNTQLYIYFFKYSLGCWGIQKFLILISFKQDIDAGLTKKPFHKRTSRSEPKAQHYLSNLKDDRQNVKVFHHAGVFWHAIPTPAGCRRN